MNIVTRGYGTQRWIITRGYGGKLQFLGPPLWITHKLSILQVIPQVGISKVVDIGFTMHVAFTSHIPLIHRSNICRVTNHKSITVTQVLPATKVTSRSCIGIGEVATNIVIDRPHIPVNERSLIRQVHNRIIGP
jgi:hypothetical protein